MARRKAALSTGATYESLLIETRRLIREPKWHSIGYACHVASAVFGKTITQFHTDLFKEALKNGEEDLRTISSLNQDYIAYRFRELCSPAMKNVTPVRSAFYWASQDKQFREDKISADESLKKIMRQRGGVRRIAGQLNQIASAATLLTEHPELVYELSPATIENAIKALNKLIMCLKKGVSKKAKKAA